MKVGENLDGLDSQRFAESVSQTFAKTRWNWQTPKLGRNEIGGAVDNGAKWSNNHMYRTSSHDM